MAGAMTAIDRAPKPCLHPQTQHRHGTKACYGLDRCRCLPCCNAISVYEQDRKKRNAYGRSNLIDAGPARAHVAALMAAGVGAKTISARSGVAHGALWRLMYGKTRPDGTQIPSRRITRATADRLLALHPDDGTLLADGARVDGTGTRRRLQALACLGWSIGRLAADTGLDRQALDQAMRGGQVVARNARAVAAAYEQLWNQRAPATDHRERISVARSINRATAAGWLPPIAWDDDTIDDPAATPTVNDDVDQVDELAVDAVLDGHTMPLSGVTLLAAVERMTTAAYPLATIATRLQIPEHQIHRLRGRDTVTPRYRTRTAA